MSSVKEDLGQGCWSLMGSGLVSTTNGVVLSREDTGNDHHKVEYTHTATFRQNVNSIQYCPKDDPPSSVPFCALHYAPLASVWCAMLQCWWWWQRPPLASPWEPGCGAPHSCQ